METTLLVLPLADDPNKNNQRHMTWGGLGSTSSKLKLDSC